MEEVPSSLSSPDAAQEFRDKGLGAKWVSKVHTWTLFRGSGRLTSKVHCLYNPITSPWRFQILLAENKYTYKAL